MQRKKLLSVCVAMALSGQTWATDTSILDITDDTRKSSKITCPANIHSISKEQLAKLPSECRDSDDSAVMSWTAAGLVAVVTGAAVMALNDGDHHDSSDLFYQMTVVIHLFHQMTVVIHLFLQMTVAIHQFHQTMVAIHQFHQTTVVIHLFLQMTVATSLHQKSPKSSITVSHSTKTKARCKFAMPPLPTAKTVMEVTP